MAAEAPEDQPAREAEISDNAPDEATDGAAAGPSYDEGATIRLDLLSTSRATDAAYLAAADIADIAAELDVPYRLVGGNCVTLLVAAYQVTGVPPRDTADADLGASYEVVGDPRLQASLLERGYARTAGNRFERPHEDALGTIQLTVDVLAPAYAAQMRSNRSHGDLVVDEVPGLAMALARDAVVVDIEVRLTFGDRVAARLLLPDPVAALCMKAAAWDGRHVSRDAVDIWRLLETAYAAGIRSADWPLRASGLDAARVLHRFFATPANNPYRDAQVASSVPTRVRALVAAVVAPPSR
jgi:hypothetical protein